MSGIPFHPIANFWPLMEGEEFDRLCKHMALTGYDPHRPVILYQGMILDGRNRSRAADRCNITPPYREWDGELGSPEAYVRAANFDRKHLAPSQIAMMAVEYDREWMRKAGPAGPAGPVAQEDSVDGASWPPVHDGKPLSAIAEEFGVSERTLKRANRVVAKGADAVKQAVQDGTLTLTDAANIVELPPAEQTEAVKKVKKGKARTASAAVGKNWQGVSEDAGPAGPVLDKLGFPVPPNLHDVFSTNLHRDIAQHCKDAHRLMRSAEAWNPFLLLALHLSGLEVTAEHALQAEPYAVCKKCLGDEEFSKSCDVCRKAGWLPKWRYDEAFP